MEEALKRNITMNEARQLQKVVDTWIEREPTLWRRWFIRILQRGDQVRREVVTAIMVLLGLASSIAIEAGLPPAEMALVLIGIAIGILFVLALWLSKDNRKK